MVDVGGFVQQGVDLGHAELVTNFVTASNVYNDVTGLAVTLECDGSPIIVTAYAPYLVNAQASADASLQLTMDGQTVQLGTFTAMAAGKGGPVFMSTPSFSPARGEHTFKLQMRSSVNGQNATLWAFPTAPAHISVKRA